MSNKPRDIASIESGLAEAIKLLKDKGIEESTGKSASFLRKCSDPDLDQQIDHKDSIKIDQYSIKQNKGHPMLTAHQYIIGKELEKIDSVTDIDDLLVKFTILQGKLMGKIKSATDPVGEKGQNISMTEKKDIFEALHALERKLTKIKQIVENS